MSYTGNNYRGPSYAYGTMLPDGSRYYGPLGDAMTIAWRQGKARSVAKHAPPTLLELQAAGMTKDQARAYLRQKFGLYGGSGSGSGSGGSGTDGLVQSYASAFNKARNANQSRYNSILGMFDNMMGGGAGLPASAGRTSFNGGRRTNSRFAQWRASGSALPYMQWVAIRRRLETEAANRGGSFGGIDASGVYPREFGSGQFILPPGQARQPNPQLQYTIPQPPPVTPFAMPVRNY